MEIHQKDDDFPLDGLLTCLKRSWKWVEISGFESTGVRNSALTMLLRDCLGGGARALLIANIGPEKDWQSETFMTLRRRFLHLSWL